MAQERNSKNPYAEEEKATWCQLASEVGVRDACKELGYPNQSYAYRWVELYDVTLPDSDLMVAARVRKNQYRQAEMRELITATMDRIQMQLSVTFAPKDLLALTTALGKLNEMMLLLDGKNTQQIGVNTKDETQLHIDQLIAQMEVKRRADEEV